MIFQRSEISDVVNPAGWSRWDAAQPVDNVVYQEYKNHGPGAAGPRANFSSQLRKPIVIEDVFGRNFKQEVWVDAEYL